MKMFAYYLPQFHCIPENDKWWGKGFTEWTNVQKATPLYKGHIQPKHPLNNYYYSLDDINTLKWQSKLLNDYNIDGLIFYHYYFTGKKLLEKPAEMLLKNENININFFFCWANHSWFRSWENSKELLIEQKYGGKEEWEKHFEYLLPFFKDKRYQKYDNKPIFMIFSSEFIEKNEMFDFFNKKCIENGFNGICVIETLRALNYKQIENFYTEKSNSTVFVHLREPDSSKDEYNSKFKYLKKLMNFTQKNIYKIRNILHISDSKFIKIYSGNALFDLMYKSYYFDKKLIRCIFFEWDNTPRHNYRGYVITQIKKDKFNKYMNLIKDNEFVFINAWNEWCEGMTIEPTEENGYKYLEWIKEWKEKNG